MIPAVLYTRAGCHLCERAEQVLRAQAAAGAVVLEVVDVDADPALEQRYGLRVPVVLLDGVEVAEYELDEQALAAAISARGGQASGPGQGTAAPVAAAAAAPTPAGAPAGGAGGRAGGVRWPWWLALLLHLGLAVFPFSATGLLAPLGGVVAFYAVWGVLLGVLLSRFREPRWWVLVVPAAAAAAWVVVLTFGDLVLGWTA